MHFIRNFWEPSTQGVPSEQYMYMYMGGCISCISGNSIHHCNTRSKLAISNVLTNLIYQLWLCIFKAKLNRN